MFKLFSNGQVLQPDMTFRNCSLLVQDNCFCDILESGEVSQKQIESEVDLNGQFVFPGLINSHDHLIDTCWKALGKMPALNWFEWNQSVHNSPDYKLMQKLSLADLYGIGMYKNAISGVTTVVDHFPPEVSSTFFNHTLVTLLQHFYLAHSFSTHRLKWCTSLIEQLKQTRGILPFIIHVGEGQSQEIKEEIEQLNRLGALEKNTVLVNGTFLEEADLQLIAAKKSSIVWLPNSSEHIFGCQPNIKRIIELGIPLTIGTDSSISGSGNLLDDLKKAFKYSQDCLNGLLTAKDLINMATQKAAHIFGIDKNTGTISLGKMANFIVFPQQKGVDPFEALLNQKPENFSMVVHNGIMVVGNDEFRRISSVDLSQYSEVLLNGTSKLLLGHPVQLLERIRHKLGENITFPFLNIDNEY